MTKFFKWVQQKLFNNDQEIIEKVVKEASQKASRMIQEPSGQVQEHEKELSKRYFLGKEYVEKFFADLPYGNGEQLFGRLTLKPGKAARGVPTLLGLLKVLEKSGLAPWEIFSLKEYTMAQKRGAWEYFQDLKARRKGAR